MLLRIYVFRVYILINKHLLLIGDIMEFLEKHYRKIVLLLLVLIFGVNTTMQAIKAAFPDATALTSEVMGVLIEDAVKAQVQPLVESVESLEGKVDILYYNAADEWIRLIDKQYDKLQSNASNLYWMDVEYVINKWDKMPDDYVTTPLTLKMDYIMDRYDNFIANGGGI